MLKVMTIVGTRPELIKMSRVIAEFDQHTNHILVHSGQNYDFELNEVFFKDLGIRKPDYFLEAAGESAISTIASVIERSSAVMAAERPDALLLYGDTNSCLSVISAKRQKIPVFHMEAGNRCFDQRVPEELNRKIVDHLSDINLVLTEHARRYLLAEGVRAETIIKTGSHMREVLDFYGPKFNSSDILERLSLASNKYFLVSIHREENIDSQENFLNIYEALNALVDNYNCPVIVSTHPRTKKRLVEMGLETGNSSIRFLKPFGFFDYIKLQLDALCVLSDSGTIFEEASILNLPAVTIRDAHERPEGMDSGTLIMSGLEKDSVINAVKVILAQHNKTTPIIPQVKDYEDGAVSKKILRVVLSNTNYVNRTVWSKK